MFLLEQSAPFVFIIIPPPPEKHPQITQTQPKKGDKTNILQRKFDVWKSTIPLNTIIFLTKKQNCRCKYPKLGILLTYHFSKGSVRMDFSLAPYYLIQLNPPPRKLFARQITKKNYRWTYDDSHPLRCEIIYLQEGSVSEVRRGEEVTWPQGSVRTAFFNHCRETFSHDPVTCEQQLEFVLTEPPVPLSAEEAVAWKNTTHFAVLPECITDPDACKRIAALIRTALKLVRMDSQDPGAMARSMRLRSIMYECLAILTEQAVQQAQSQLKAKNESPYTEKARKYILSHLQDISAVEDISKFVGVSYGHLNRVFRADMNMTLLEYINLCRIHAVERYITEDRLTLRKAGERVGISDEKYLSRLFRRYIGVSPAEYRRIHRGDPDL